MEPFPIIPISQRLRPVIDTPIYLAFNHAGPGHDALVFKTKSEAANDER